MNRVAAPDLKHHLDAFLDSFPKAHHVSNDPVQFVHRYDDPRDREIAGIIVSAFAYGNVKSILATAPRALSFLGNRPAQALAAFDPRHDARRLRGFYHRFNTSRDLAVFFWMLRKILERYDSIEQAFLKGLSSDDADTGAAMERFSAEMLGTGYEQFYPRGELKRRIGVRFLVPSPTDGSACKRMNLYLRWMVRPADGVDCGVWTRIRKDQLVIPLDTHIARISRYIGLTNMKSPGWRMALDITNGLRRLDASDPLRYDFALCHLGIAGNCPRKRDLRKCFACPIRAICLL
jgi:uncharacterized protein (TIGR02757 family)